jgi:hypothetical protein
MCADKVSPCNKVLGFEEETSSIHAPADRSASDDLIDDTEERDGDDDNAQAGHNPQVNQ